MALNKIILFVALITICAAIVQAVGEQHQEIIPQSNNVSPSPNEPITPEGPVQGIIQEPHSRNKKFAVYSPYSYTYPTYYPYSSISYGYAYPKIYPYAYNAAYYPTYYNYLL
ncbi:hypothetical protein PGB90_008173 [Kerria lacca]